MKARIHDYEAAAQLAELKEEIQQYATYGLENADDELAALKRNIAEYLHVGLN